MASILTAEKLAKILEISTSSAGAWMPHLDATMTKYAINSRLRIAAWIAQVGHESARLKTKEENLNYSAEGLLSTFPSYFDSKTASEYARQPEKIANRAYANRLGNKNEASGDGWKFRGRGLIQVTGMENYQQCSKALGINLLDNPDALLDDANAAMSAGWFWGAKGLNNYADRKDFDTTTRRINPAMKGKADRDAIYQRALKVLTDEDPDTDKDILPSIEPDKTTTISKELTPVAKKMTVAEPAYGGGKSSYPNNIVYESPSGHIVEFDDTPGSERIHVYHRTGAYFVIDPVGSTTMKTVVDHTHIVGGDRSAQIEGDDTTTISGQSYTKAGDDIIMKSGGTITAEAPDKMQVNAPLLTFDEELNGPTAQFQDLTSTTGQVTMLQSTAITTATISAGVVLCGAIFFGMVGGGFASMSDSIDLGNGSGGSDDKVTIKKDVVNNKNSMTNGSARSHMPTMLGATTQEDGTQKGVEIQGFIDTDNSDQIWICYKDFNDGDKWKRISDDTEYTGPGTESGGIGGAP